MLFHVKTCCLRPFLQRRFVVSCYFRLFSLFFGPGGAVPPRRPDIPPARHGFSGGAPVTRPFEHTRSCLDSSALAWTSCPKVGQASSLSLLPLPAHFHSPAPSPQPGPVWSMIALAINPTPATASNVGLAWISLDSGSDSPQFGSIHLHPAGLSLAAPARPVVPGVPAVLLVSAFSLSRFPLWLPQRCQRSNPGGRHRPNHLLDTFITGPVQLFIQSDGCFKRAESRCSVLVFPPGWNRLPAGPPPLAGAAMRRQRQPRGLGAGRGP